MGSEMCIRDSHDNLVIFATRLNDELVGADAILKFSNTLLSDLVHDLSVASLIGSEELLATDGSLNVVLLQCLTEHLSPLEHVGSDLLTSVSGGSEFSEGGGGHVVF